MYGWLIIYWLVFGLLHSLLAATGVKQIFSHLMGKQFRYYRFYYSIISFLLLGWIIYYQYAQADRFIFIPPVAMKVAALILLFPALLVMGVCIRKYFFHLSGIDVFFPTNAAKPTLETGGLNKYVRHPLYTGTFLLVICLWAIWPTIGNTISASMVILYTCIGTLFEEKKLRREFGEAYILYQQEVPMLIPFIRKRKPAQGSSL